jgi:hypothetical protein
MERSTECAAAGLSLSPRWVRLNGVRTTRLNFEENSRFVPIRWGRNSSRPQSFHDIGHCANRPAFTLDKIVEASDRESLPGAHDLIRPSTILAVPQVLGSPCEVQDALGSIEIVEEHTKAHANCNGTMRNLPLSLLARDSMQTCVLRKICVSRQRVRAELKGV